MALPQFGNLEAAVMERVWARGRAVNVREILEDLQQDRTIAYTTVMTVMDNLFKKGFLKRRRVGKAYEYEAVASRESHTAKLMRQVLATSENPAAALVHFLSDLSPQESEALQAALKIVPPRASS